MKLLRQELVPINGKSGRYALEYFYEEIDDAVFKASEEAKATAAAQKATEEALHGNDNN